MSASLYQRLGGAAGVAAVVDDAIDRHTANPLLAPRFRGQDLPQLKALGVQFLSAGSGGPCDDLAPAEPPQHAGMRFSACELQAVLRDMADALAEKGVGAAEASEVASLFRGTSGAAGNDPRTRAA